MRRLAVAIFLLLIGCAGAGPIVRFAPDDAFAGAGPVFACVREETELHCVDMETFLKLARSKQEAEEKRSSISL